MNFSGDGAYGLHLFATEKVGKRFVRNLHLQYSVFATPVEFEAYQKTSQRTRRTDTDEFN